MLARQRHVFANKVATARRWSPQPSSLWASLSSSSGTPRTRKELVGSLPPIYPLDLCDHIRRDVDAVGRMLVVLDDDPTGTQTVHSVPVLAEWSVDILAKEVCLSALVTACRSR